MDPAVEVNPEPVTPMQTEEPVVEEPDDIPQIFPPAKDSEETNVSLTEEIVTFVNRIDSPTLLDLLVQLGCDPLTEDAASQEERIQKFEALVVYKFGVESFYNMLLSFPDLLASIQTAIGGVPGGTKDDFLKAVETIGFLPFFQSLSDQILSEICQMLVLPDPVLKAETSVARTLADEIMLRGGQALFTSIAKTDAVLSVAKQLGIDVETVPHDDLVDALMVQIFDLEPFQSFQKLLQQHSKQKPNKRKRDREDEEDDSDLDSEETERRKKGKHVCPPLARIKKGVTRDDLHNNYNVTDLQTWCKDNDIVHVGKKTVLIKHILEFLDTGRKPRVPQKKKRKTLP